MIALFIFLALGVWLALQHTAKGRAKWWARKHLIIKYMGPVVRYLRDDWHTMVTDMKLWRSMRRFRKGL